MNRDHSRDDYFRIIDDLRSARPDMAVSGDFIVGFPVKRTILQIPFNLASKYLRPIRLNILRARARRHRCVMIRSMKM